MISALLIAVPLIAIGIAVHVAAVLLCQGGTARDDDQETGS
jgi:hypothetical protein